MSFFTFEVLTVIVLFVAAVVAGIWVHRLDKEQYDQPAASPGLDDNTRRLLQLGIGLSGSSSTGLAGR